MATGSASATCPLGDTEQAPVGTRPDDAEGVVGAYIDYYNGVRLHSAIGYVTSNDVLADRQQEIWDERDRKLADARATRAQRRQATRSAA